MRGEVRFCHGRQEHWNLRGMHNGVSRTKLAEPYPYPLCATLAAACCNFAQWHPPAHRPAKCTGPIIGDAMPRRTLSPDYGVLAGNRHRVTRAMPCHSEGPGTPGCRPSASPRLCLHQPRCEAGDAAIASRPTSRSRTSCGHASYIVEHAETLPPGSGLHFVSQQPFNELAHAHTGSSQSVRHVND